MSHLHTDRTRLLARIRRIKGQAEAIEAGIIADADCNQVLQTIAACRGALNGLMAEVIEGHVRFHVLDPKRKPTPDQMAATDQLLAVVNAYLK